jgi:hypothetical protein
MLVDGVTAIRRRRCWIRTAAPIAAPMNTAPYQKGETRSITATPNIASHIAGRQSRQSPVMSERMLEDSNGVHPV